MILLMILIIPIQVIIFLVVPMPETALGWLELYKDNPVMGLLHMDFLYNIFLIFFYFALFITLKKDKDNSLINIALITGIVGAILYYASNRSIEMLYLTNRYYETTDTLIRQSYLANVEIYLDVWKGTAFNIYYVMSAVSLLTFSFIMLKNTFIQELPPSLDLYQEYS